MSERLHNGLSASDSGAQTSRNKNCRDNQIEIEIRLPSQEEEYKIIEQYTREALKNNLTKE